MKINLWAKKGIVTLTIVNDSTKSAVPTLTIDIKDPQIIYDDFTNKISIIETT